MNRKPDSILFIRPDTYGDLVLFEPVLREMKKAWPHTRIGVLIQERYKDITALMPAGINWLGTSCNPHRESPSQCHEEILRLREVLIEFTPDIIVSACFDKTWLDAVVASWFSNGDILSAGAQQLDPVSAALVRSHFGIDTSDMFRNHVAMERDSGELEKNMALLAHLLAKDVHKLCPVLAIPDVAQKWAAEWLAAQGMTPGKFIACCPCGTANVRIKKWPAEQYIHVLSRAMKTHDMKTVLLGHVSEREDIKSVYDGCQPDCTTWFGNDGEIAKLAAIIDLSRFYLGNDTGAMHIAAALGKPTIVIFGGGTWPRFRPASRSFINIVQPLSCFKCDWNCVFGSALCIERIPFAPINAAIDELFTVKSVAKDLYVEPCFSTEEMHMIDLVSTNRQHVLMENTTGINLHTINQLVVQLQASEADRAARLEVIEAQGQKLGRIPQLEVDKEHLIAQLQASEADRATRLEVIYQQGRQLDYYREKLNILKRQRIYKWMRRMGKWGWLEEEENNQTVVSLPTELPKSP